MPRGVISLLIVTVLVQAFLLHGKSMGATTRQGAIENGFNINTHSSCSPKQYQLKYINKLYCTNTVNSFSGNAFYYSFKAMEIHKNRTGSTTTTMEEDNIVIANISDQSRFIPVGMDTANKVVCAQILQELDAKTSAIFNTVLCHWDYICDYKVDRYPYYLFKARCKTSMCSGNYNPKFNRHNMCQSHGIFKTILQMRNCEEWVWDEELLPTACRCASDVTMKP